MKKLVSISTPGRMTVLATLIAALSAPVLAQTTPPAADHVVISQIYGTGGNGSGSTAAKYRYDFVELFNPTATDISIAGWSVQYAATANTSGYSVAAGLTGTIGAGKYYLVRLGSQAVLGDDVAPYDATGNVATGGTNISGANGKVALASNSTALVGSTPTSANLVDLVGFGTANGFEGAPAISPTNNQSSIYRANLGCTDTNNNAADFSIATATLRNSSTAAVSCGGTTVPVNAAIVASCPAPITVLAGTGGSASFSATDPDSIVNAASTASGTNAGITVSALSPATADGGTLTATLNVGTSVAPGSYSVVLNFANNESQTASCTVPVTVSAAPSAQYTIMQLQGSGENSPHPGVQTTEGVITLKLPAGGFYIQDRNGDGDPATSDALYIYATTTTYNVGDKIRITGTVTDFKQTGATHAITEMKDVSNITFIASEAPITPTNITMPTDLSRYESMLVNITNSLIVNDTGSLGDRGELTLSSIRREVPTNHFRPGPQAQAMAAANAADQIVLDDQYFTQQPTIPYLAADNTVRAGDSVSNLVGVIDYGSIGNSNYGYKFQPSVVSNVQISRTNARPTAPQLPAGNVRVASANVLNFFTTFTDGTAFDSTATTNGCYIGSSGIAKGNCRGADSQAEFVRQRTKIVNELKALDADVVGLMEIQNNGNVAVQHLVDTLNGELGGPIYAAVAVPGAIVPATGTSQALGTDAIRVAMIYKPRAVTPVGDPLTDTDPVNERPPLAQSFKATNGAVFSVIVNHLKSKRCDGASGLNKDLGDGQGCYNANRLLQAQRLRGTFIPAVIRNAANDPDVLIIGDFNSHGFEDPINALAGDGFMVNELERFVRPTGLVYSYVFDGEAGYLDHALATAALNTQVAGAMEFHNNADEPEVIDYNFNLGTSKLAKPQDLYADNAYRASDHDPVVVSLNLTPTFANVTGSFSTYRSGLAINRSTGQFSGTITFTNTTGATINGPFQVEFSGLPSGVTLANATGSHNGVPYLTSGTTSVAPGATVTLSTVFNNPGKGAIPYTATIYSGTF